MDQSNHPLQEVSRLRLLAAALELQHLTSTASNAVPIPGTERFVAIGTPAEVARLLAGSAAEQPNGDLPPLPLDLDNSPARMSIQIKAGELAELIRRWGREVYLAGQSQATRAVPEGYALVPLNWTPEMRRAWDLAPWNEDDDKEFANAYRAMIAAAPQAPTAQEVTQQAAPEFYMGVAVGMEHKGATITIMEKHGAGTTVRYTGMHPVGETIARLNIGHAAPASLRDPAVTQQAAKAETGGVQAKTWKDAPYKLDHVAEAWARGWNDARAEFAKPKSDLTTVDCPECAGTGAVEAGEACDECDGQAKLIVSRKDLADLAPTTSTVSTPNFQAWGEQFSKQPHEGSHDYVTGWNECVAAAVVALSSSTVSAQEEVRNQILDEAIAVVPGGSICDPQQVADAIGALKRTTSGKGEEV